MSTGGRFCWVAMVLLALAAMSQAASISSNAKEQAHSRLKTARGSVFSDDLVPTNDNEMDDLKLLPQIKSLINENRKRSHLKPLGQLELTNTVASGQRQQERQRVPGTYAQTDARGLPVIRLGIDPRVPDSLNLPFPGPRPDIELTREDNSEEFNVMANQNWIYQEGSVEEEHAKKMANMKEEDHKQTERRQYNAKTMESNMEAYNKAQDKALQYQKNELLAKRDMAMKQIAEERKTATEVQRLMFDSPTDAVECSSSTVQGNPGYIYDWLLLGPFGGNNVCGVVKASQLGNAETEPHFHATAGHQAFNHQWIRYNAPNTPCKGETNPKGSMAGLGVDVRCAFRNIIGSSSATGVSAYAFSNIYSWKAMKADFYFSGSEGSMVWVNGFLTIDDAERCSDVWSDATTSKKGVPLAEGRNPIIVKIGLSRSTSDWGFILRFSEHGTNSVPQKVTFSSTVQ